MFIKETKETNTYTKSSKYGKLSSYKRTKTVTHWKCDCCGIEFTKIRNGKYDLNAKSYCKDCLLKEGRFKLANRDGYLARAEKHSQKQNIVLDKDGYKDVYYGLEYPYREGYGFIREHIYVMECHLGRKLEKGEIVHHIDGDKRNNNIENLFLTTPAEHNKLHGSSEQLIFELFKLGIISFNRETARYYIIQPYVQSKQI